jgi:hypothetical protein
MQSIFIIYFSKSKSSANAIQIQVCILIELPGLYVTGSFSKPCFSPERGALSGQRGYCVHHLGLVYPGANG